MGLDFYLHAKKAFKREPSSGIFVRRDGRQKEITREEWDILNPGVEPACVIMPEETTVLYHGHITHNLVKMANAAGIYEVLWGPEENAIEKAAQLKVPVTKALERLYARPDLYCVHDDPGGWGTFETLCEFLEEVLAACYRWPDARVEASR
jgi:hypothetical protein